jgi:hypothetical protein
MYLLTGEPDTCAAILHVQHEEASLAETPGMERDVRQFHRPGFTHCLVNCVGMCGRYSGSSLTTSIDCC